MADTAHRAVSGGQIGRCLLEVSVVRVMAGAGLVTLVVAAAGGVASATPTASRLPLTARVLHAGDLLGLRPQNRVVVVRRADQWALTEPPGSPFDATELRKNGFAGGITEHLRWQARDTEGLSVVVQLGSNAAARKYLTSYSGLAAPFPVVGVPGARGFGDSGGINIVFADGDYAYLVGAGWKPGSTHTVTKAQLLAAAKLLYHRVHGH